MHFETTKDILKRMVATAIYKIAGILATGSIVGVETWKLALMAGVTGVLEVSTGLSKAFLKDGKIDLDEVNAVFNDIADKGSNKSDR